MPVWLSTELPATMHFVMMDSDPAGSVRCFAMGGPTTDVGQVQGGTAAVGGEEAVGSVEKHLDAKILDSWAQGGFYQVFREGY